MADPILYVGAPARRPRRGGIRTVAGFVSQERLAATSTVQYTSEGCGLPQDDWTLCYDLEPGAEEKTFDGVDTNVSPIPNFVAYSGVQCFLNSEDDFAERARNLLALGEDRIIERKLGAYLLAESTPGTAVSVVAAIAAAEQFLDTTYPALGVIVMSRAGSVYAKAADAIEGDNEGNLWTPNGTPVLASGEITDGFIFATGAITVFEGPVTNITAPNWSTNIQAAIAERAFGLAFDCGIAEAFAVDYTLGGGGGGVDGASAYDIAVANGFVGTEVEWLASLVGADGTNATITSVTATGLAAGAEPTVTAGGTPSARTFAFGIPAGAEGDPGAPGVVQSVVAGTGATVDSTDPANPVVSVP